MSGAGRSLGVSLLGYAAILLVAAVVAYLALAAMGITLFG